MAEQPRSFLSAIGSPTSINRRDFRVTANLVAFLALFLHIVDALFLFNRRELVGVFFFAYLILAVVAWLFVYGGFATYDGSSRASLHLERFITLLGAALLAWGLPWLRAIFFRFLPNAFTLYVDSVVVFFPIFLLFLILTPQYSTPKLQWLGTIYIFIWLLLFSVNFFAQIDTVSIGELSVETLEVYAPQLIDVTLPIWNTLAGARDAAVATYTYVTGIPAKMESALQRQVEFAIDPAAKAVEESAEKRVGVFVDTLRRTGERLFVGDEVAAFSEIEARLLEEDQEINVQVACVATHISSPTKSLEELYEQHEPRTIVGEVLPKEELSIFSYDRQPVDCRWPTQLQFPGRYTLDMYVTFPFDTLGYMPVYFTAEDQLRQYIRDDATGRDIPVDLDTLPTEYTSGPVGTGLSLGQGTIGVEDTPRVYTMGAWVENVWSGTITKINHLYFLVPKEFRVQQVVGTGLPAGPVGPDQGGGVSCDDLAMKYGREICDAETTDVYRVKVREEEIKLRKNFRVDLFLEDPLGLLENQPYTKEFMKILADYEYRFNPSTTVTIHEPPEKRTAGQVIDPLLSDGQIVRRGGTTR